MFLIQLSILQSYFLYLPFFIVTPWFFNLGLALKNAAQTGW